MKKPVIVCDIDDVVYPFVDGVAAHYNQLHGATLTAADFVSFDFSQVWGGTQDEANEIVDAFLESDTLHLEPLPGVKEAFTQLSEDFDIVLVTARNGMFAESTTTWLRAHMPDLFREVIFAGNTHDGRGYRPKGEICKELGAVLIIDDHPSNVASALERGIDGILFGNKAWTLEGREIYTDAMHCPDWTSVLEYIYGPWKTKRLS